MQRTSMLFLPLLAQHCWSLLLFGRHHVERFRNLVDIRIYDGKGVTTDNEGFDHVRKVALRLVLAHELALRRVGGHE